MRLKSRVYSGTLASILFISTLMFFFNNCGKGFQLKTSDEQSLEFPSTSKANLAMKCEDRKNLSASTLRKLTKTEYQNTLRDLLGPTIMQGLNSEFATLPTDSVEGLVLFDTALRGASGSQIDAYFLISEKIVDLVFASNSELSKIATCLPGLETASATNSNTCINTVASDFGKKIYRRPLTSSEVNRYNQLFQSFLTEGQSKTDAAKSILMSLLNSPHFLYLPEINGTASSVAGVYNLTPFEIASRLSYMLWRSGPDSELLTSATNGTLSTATEIEIQAERMMADPRFESTTKDFISAWLQLGSTKSPSFSTTFLEGYSTDNLKPAMINEIEKFAHFHIHQKKGTFSDLFLSTDSFINAESLAKVYDVTMPTNSTGQTSLPTAQLRGGLLTRVAALNAGRDETSPIHRGAVIRRHILCDPLPSPDPTQLPAGALNLPPPDPTKTSRERWTQKTSGNSCIGCHSQINGFGFALEKFDAMGRFRSHEKILNPSTNQTNLLPIDDAVEVYLDDVKPVTIYGPVDLSKAIATSVKANQCFAKQWFRYSYGRNEDFNADGCVINEMEQHLTEKNGSMTEMFKKLILAPSFTLVKPKI